MSLTDNIDSLMSSFPSKKEEDAPIEEQKDFEHYDTSGLVRNLYLIDADGNETFFNYADLRKGKYSPEENSITLTFFSDIVILKGHNLKGLSRALSVQRTQSITVVDKRYAATRDDAETYITEISIKPT